MLRGIARATSWYFLFLPGLPRTPGIRGVEEKPSPPPLVVTGVASRSCFYPATILTQNNCLPDKPNVIPYPTAHPAPPFTSFSAALSQRGTWAVGMIASEGANLPDKRVGVAGLGSCRH